MNANAIAKPSVWPPQSLDLEGLTLLAFYFSPELDEARSRLAAADAAIVTAGARPNPSISGAAGYTDAEESPYALRFGISIPFETGGKRGYRIRWARQLTEAARFAVGETAWNVRSRIRAALIDHLISNLELEQRTAETRVREEAAGIYEKRLEFGGVSRPDVTAARADLARVQIESFGEGNNSYTIGTALVLPIFDRNRGPIAEAVARRSTVGDRFLRAQAKAIDEVERALIDYRSARDLSTLPISALSCEAKASNSLPIN